MKCRVQGYSLTCGTHETVLKEGPTGEREVAVPSAGVEGEGAGERRHKQG